MKRLWNPHTVFPPELKTVDGFGAGKSVVVYGVIKNDNENEVLTVSYDFRFSKWITAEGRKVEILEWMPLREYVDLNNFKGSVESSHWCRLFCPQNGNCQNQVGNSEPYAMVAPCDWE